MLTEKELESALYCKHSYRDQLFWRIADRAEKIYQIKVDTVNYRLIDFESDKILYEEKHDGGIDLADVLDGRQKWESGDKFTLEDFLRECLEIYNFRIK